MDEDDDYPTYAEVLTDAAKHGDQWAADELERFRREGSLPATSA